MWQKNQNMKEFEVESLSINGNALQIHGWMNPVRCVSVRDCNDIQIDIQVDSIHRSDIWDEDGVDAGFCIQISENIEKRYPIVISFEGLDEVYRITEEDIKKVTGNKLPGKLGLVQKGLKYLKRQGVFATVKKTYRRVSDTRRYARWISLSEKESKVDFSSFSKEELPLISIVVPLYRTNETYLREMIESVEKQSYPKWELCLADGSETPSPLVSVLEEKQRNDNRIHVKYLEENKGIAGNTNSALEMANGDFIALLDHDDLIPSNALAEVVKAYLSDRTIDFIYTDQDLITLDGSQRYLPNFKPDFSIQYLRSINYICHFLVISKELYEKVGGFSREFDGAQDYDFILRCSENAEQIHHIPKVLYHWRAHPDSTAGDPKTKQYAFLAGKRAVMAHLKRVGIDADVSLTNFPGVQKIDYHRALEDEYVILGVEDAVLLEGSYERLKNIASQKGVAVVGGAGVNDKNKIIQCGIFFDFENKAYDYVFEGEVVTEGGYMDRLHTLQNYMAVTGPVVIRKSLFDELGGLSTDFDGEAAVLDLCLRAYEKGYENVYDPYVKFVYKNHRKDKSQEQKLVTKWSEKWKKDPFNNPNLKKGFWY